MSVKSSNYERLKAERTLVDLYREDLSGDSLTGVVSHFNNDFICMGLVSDGGEQNGISVVWAHDVSRVRWNSNSLNSIRQLMKARNSAPIFPIVDLSSVRRIVESVQRACGHVTIHVERLDSGVCFIGEVSELDGDHVVLNEFGSLRSRDSASIMISLEDITRIDGGGRYEVDISMLAKTPLKRD